MLSPSATHFLCNLFTYGTVFLPKLSLPEQVLSSLNAIPPKNLKLEAGGNQNNIFLVSRLP